MTRATVFAPGSIANVGPGFDVLALALDGMGDRVTVELTRGEPAVESITGRDADLIPAHPESNIAVLAAKAWLQAAGVTASPIVSIDKGLPLSGGLGGSAASAVGGAYAAALAAGATPRANDIIAAAYHAEIAITEGALDNIGACTLGGFVLCRTTDPLDVVALHFPDDWWIALVTPYVRIETRRARAILPLEWDRSCWTRQMANTAAVVYGFATGDAALVRRAFADQYAEPHRAALIPRFAEVKAAAIDAGAIGCSIGGAGPTIFAIAQRGDAERCLDAMVRALGDVPHEAHVGAAARKGAHPL